MTYEDAIVSDKMEVNGYGYLDFRVDKSEIEVPGYHIPVTDGEFILNLHDGKKQIFKPFDMHIHCPSEHSLNGKFYDAELSLMHHYKGTDD